MRAWHLSADAAPLRLLDIRMQNYAAKQHCVLTTETVRRLGPRLEPDRDGTVHRAQYILAAGCIYPFSVRWRLRGLSLCPSY